MARESVKHTMKMQKRKLITAYVVKMTFFYIMLIVLGIAATLKVLHVFGVHIYRQ